MEDVPVGPQPEQYMHTTSGGVPDGPPLVLGPGYGAGTGFFFRSVHARLHEMHSANRRALHDATKAIYCSVSSASLEA